jgi:hypothetical protein
MYDPFLSREWGENHGAMSADIDRMIRKLRLLFRRRTAAPVGEPAPECRPGAVGP